MEVILGGIFLVTTVTLVVALFVSGFTKSGKTKDRAAMVCLVSFAAIIASVLVGSFLHEDDSANEEQHVIDDIKQLVEGEVHSASTVTERVKVELTPGCIYSIEYEESPDGAYVLVDGSGVLTEEPARFRDDGTAYTEDCPDEAPAFE